jgi:hypothetical protein
MAKQLINRGSNANDGTGDSLRDGADKLNDNFSEIYSVLGNGENLLTTDIDFGTNKLLHSNVVATTTELNAIDATRYHGLVMHVHATGGLYYAHAGAWRKLLSDNGTSAIPSYTDSLDTVAYSGNYNDLSSRPTIPSVLTDINIVDGSAGQVLSTDGTGNFTFRDVVATSIPFADVTGKPTTNAGYGITDSFTGRYEDLTNKPVLFDGAYASLTGSPSIPSDLNDLTDDNGLLFDGNYNSLNGRPTIPADLSDITDTTNLLFSRSYNDLTNKPTSFALLTTLSMGLGIEIDEFSNDTGLTDNSETALVTERAVKTFVNNNVPSTLTDIGITDGTVGQVLTTDGVGNFTFQAAGDTIGNFTLAASLIDTDDSSAISFVPSVIIRSDLTVENSLTVTNDLTVGGDISSTGTGSPEVFSNTDIKLTASTRVEVSNSPFKFASYTDAERNNITVENGDVIYNTTTSKFQGYAGGAWVDFH